MLTDTLVFNEPYPRYYKAKECAYLRHKRKQLFVSIDTQIPNVTNSIMKIVKKEKEGMVKLNSKGRV